MRPVFKDSKQDQPSLFPFNFGSLVEENHPARIINEVIDKLDISDILNSYKGGGTSSYHPRTMLKIIIYGYLNNLYSCRKIAKAVKENVVFIWLSGERFPDYRTINAFRGKRLKSAINDIFRQVVLFLESQGAVTLEEIFTDGTKLESFANRYKFVWKKNIERFKANLESKIESILSDIEQVIVQDDKEIKKETQNPPKATISVKEINKRVEEINRKLKKDKTPKTINNKINKLKKEYLPKLSEYEIKLNILGERGSYAKTDLDATFMRMKEDHMKNGQLKPAYNIQISTENNFITNYTAHQNPGDTTTFQQHIESFYEKYKKYPLKAIADAGYGGLENYDYLESNNIENFVKFNYFHKEKEKKFKLDISKVENLFYNKDEDYFICPMGQKMRPVENGRRTTRTGYEYDVTIYQAENCSKCPLRGACHKQKENRKIEINKKLVKHKQIARDNLNSEQGIELRKRRLSEVEQTFGQIKGNKGFRRFLLRSLPKISIEVGLLALAHNFQKISKLLYNNDLTLALKSFSYLLTQIIDICNKLPTPIERKSFLKLNYQKDKEETTKFEIMKKAA